MSGSPPGEGSAAAEQRSVTVRLDGFAWQTIEQESTRLGVAVEELVTFSVLYYLADVDSGRIARRITGSPYAEAGPPS